MTESKEITLDSVLTENCINLDLKAKTKHEVLCVLTDMLYAEGRITSKAQFLEDVYLREKEGVTGVGGGVAIPHGRSASVLKSSIAIGRCREPVEWETLDEVPIRYIILFAVKDTDFSQHIALLSSVATALCEDEVLEQVFRTDDKTETINIFKEWR